VTGQEIAAALDAAVSTLSSVRGSASASRPASAGSWREAFDARAVAVDGGHLHWTGATTGTSGTPVVAFQGQVQTAYRLAFRWWHKREPEGNVRPRCGYPCCVFGGHLADKRIREGGQA
jgi:hypothetical protein